MKKGFTLVELVIVIVIVGILSIVAVPIYNQYVEKAKLTEGMAALSAIKIAQDVYFAQHEEYYTFSGQYNDVLGIDLRGNKYFNTFNTDNSPLCGTAAVYGTENKTLVYDWARPGVPLHTATMQGITKQVPYFYLIDEDGKLTFI